MQRFTSLSIVEQDIYDDQEIWSYPSLLRPEIPVIKQRSFFTQLQAPCFYFSKYKEQWQYYTYFPLQSIIKSNDLKKNPKKNGTLTDGNYRKSIVFILCSKKKQ